MSAPTDDLIAFGASLLGCASTTDRLNDKEALAWVREQWAEWQAARAAALSVSAPTDERAAFEAAARKGLVVAISEFDFQRDDDDEYKWFATRRLYEFWKAARAAAPVSGQGASIDTPEFRELMARNDVIYEDDIAIIVRHIMQWADRRPRSEDSRAKVPDDIDHAATAELHAILAQYPPESWAVRNRAFEEAAALAIQWGNARIDDGGGNALRNCAEAIRALATTAAPERSGKLADEVAQAHELLSKHCVAITNNGAPMSLLERIDELYSWYAAIVNDDGATEADSSLVSEYAEYTKWCAENGKSPTSLKSFAALSADSSSAAPSDIPEAIELLSAVFDAWENGDDCYEDGDIDGSYMGKAFRLDDDVFKHCCDLLNRLNPPRNAAPAPTGESLSADVAQSPAGPSEAEQVQLWKDAHGYGNQTTVGTMHDLLMRYGLPPLPPPAKPRTAGVG